MSEADYKRERALAEDGNGPPSPPSPPSPKRQTLTAVVSSGREEALTINSQARPSSKEVATTYFAQVKQAFQGERHKFEEFQTMLVNFKVKGEPNLAVMTSTIKKLFRGQEQLIVGFNAYVPENMRITLPLSEDEESDFENPQLQEELIASETKVHPQVEEPSRREMIEFFKKAQADLPEDDYRSFSETLYGFFESNRSTREVQKLRDEVKVQLKDRRDLLAEFLGFTYRLYHSGYRCESPSENC